MSNPPRLGRYELVRKIAAGGMAEIFLARQWGSAGFFRDVVVKRLFRHLGENDKQARMFQDEGRLLAELSHPNIPQVYDVGFADGHWYIAMEHVDGPTVSDIWIQGAKNNVPMPLPVAIGIVLQTCEALHHAHERTDRARRPLRIVHRDVTPQNIMLTRDGVAKLMDFGVAATTARKDTDAGAVRGTFSYMAPEQIRARPLDKRADVFALGVILYELTTNTRLYRGTDVQIMTQVVEHDAPVPSSRVADYPADLEEIVLSALQRDRSRRVPSSAHLAWRLEELALRNQILVGPRTVARYVTQVMPAEPVREEALGIVQPPSAEVVSFASSEMSSPGLHAASGAVVDQGFHDDLDLLSPPDQQHGQSWAGEALPDPLDLPVEFEPRAHPSASISVDTAFDELLSSERPGAGDVISVDDQPIDDGQGPLVLDGFDLDGGDAEAAARPVVLLTAKRPTRAQSTPTAGASGGGPAKDFMQSLERRLAEDDE
ncbi:MAG: serine/threonine protein kinase [Deltaproteobacteria bacterium]|nr:serine/threonine protein kinase [Deltaproteobacteria bacterium]